MPSPPKIGEKVYDALTAFFGGVNSGVNPTLLRRDQLAFATNTTERGGFITHRPPYRTINLDFGGDDSMQEAFEKGFFQGEGPYRQDFSNHYLIRVVSGRIFTIKAVTGSDSFVVEEVTIPGDPLSATAQQVWMFQAEKWMVISDGSGSLPIFYDGESCRRSYGPSIELAEVSAINPGIPPAIGEEVQVTLTAPYTGEFNIPVIMNNAIYEVKSFTGGSPNNARLTSLYATAGATVSGGFNVVSRPSRVGVVISSDKSPPVPYPVPFSARFNTVNAVLSSVDGLTVGASVNMDVSGSPMTWTVTSLDTATNSVTLNSGGYTFSGFVQVDIGAVVSFSGSTSPDVIVGTLAASFVNPAIGSTVDIQLNSSYTGTSGAQVWIGDSHYTIVPLVPGAPGAGLNLINLSDTSAAAYILNLKIYSVPELPACRMGAYSMGRIWISLTDGISFLAGNIVGGEAGTEANDYRDAILKTTENEYLDGGGTFRLPNSGDTITAMFATANLDASLGQGPLVVGTSRSMFSLNAPVDRATWQDVTFPILSQTLLGSGPMSQQCVFPVNSDTMMRSLDGWRSYMIARRNFSEAWGNTPITREMERVFNQEDRTLLPFVSGVQFDNRALFGAVPQSTAQGVVSTVATALNLDPVSSLSGKAPPIYDSAWSSLPIFQFTTAVIDNVNRCFAAAWDFDEDTPANSKIVLIELDRDQPTVNRFDNGTDSIEWSFETAVLFKEVGGRPLMKLSGGEIYIDNLVGEGTITVQYRADDYPCWTTWIQMPVCATPPSAENPDYQPGFQPRLGLGEPNVKDCDGYTNRPKCVGYKFQFRFACRGSFRFMGAKFSAEIRPEPEFAKPPPGSTCN